MIDFSILETLASAFRWPTGWCVSNCRWPHTAARLIFWDIPRVGRWTTYFTISRWMGTEAVAVCKRNSHWIEVVAVSMKEEFQWQLPQGPSVAGPLFPYANDPFIRTEWEERCRPRWETRRRRRREFRWKEEERLVVAKKKGGGRGNDNEVEDEQIEYKSLGNCRFWAPANRL